MDYIFCPCGAKIPKTSTIVNFCPTCGNKFSSFAYIPPKITVTATKKVETSNEKVGLEFEGNEDDGDGVEREGNKNFQPDESQGFSVEVNKKRTKMRDIMGTAKEVVPIKKGKAKKVNKKQFWSDWQKEAGTLRSGKNH